MVTLEEGIDATSDRLIEEFGEPDEGESEGLGGGRWYFGTASSISWFHEEEWLLTATADPNDGLRLGLYDGIVLGGRDRRRPCCPMGRAAPRHGRLPPLRGEVRGVSDVRVHTGIHGHTFLLGDRRRPHRGRLGCRDDFVQRLLVADDVHRQRCGLDSRQQQRALRRARLSSPLGLGVLGEAQCIAPFYSWGADCLDADCEYVAMFIGTAPPADVPTASRWKVQTSETIGGLLLAKRLDHGFELIGSAYASQSSDRLIRDPVQDAEAPHIFRFEETTDNARYEMWEIDVDVLTITRLGCEGPDRADCRPVWG